MSIYSVYCGREELKPPPEVQQRFDSDILGRLINDLNDVIVKIKIREKEPPKSADDWDANILFELRMSGRVAGGAKSVILTPSVWILCVEADGPVR